MRSQFWRLYYQRYHRLTRLIMFHQGKTKKIKCVSSKWNLLQPPGLDTLPHRLHLLARPLDQLMFDRLK